MNNISKYAIGILVGMVLIACYIFLYHKPELKKEYDRGIKDGIASVGTTLPDTIKWVDTICVKPHYIKPKPKPYEPPDKPKYAIDTTVWDDYGNVRVYSDDIAEGLNIKPTYYEFYQLIRDTVIVRKMDTVYVPDKPVIEFGNFTAGVVVGGTVVGVITYFVTKAAFKKE